MSLVENVKADARLVMRGHVGLIRRAAVAFFSRGMQAVFLYRLASWCRGHRIPVVPAILSRVSQHLYAVDISPSAQIGPGLVLVHCFGIVIGSAARIEGECVLFHGVTLGDRGSEWVGSRESDGHPTLGRGCILGAGAKVLGPVRIGDNCVIGSNSVVLTDVPDNSVAAGLPAKVVNHRPVMGSDLRPLGGVYREDQPSSVSDQTASEPAS